MVQPTSSLTLQAAATFRSAEPTTEWNGRKISSIPTLNRVAGMGSQGLSCTIQEIFTKALLPLIAIFGVAFIISESLAIAGGTTAAVLVSALFLRHTCGL